MRGLFLAAALCLPLTAQAMDEEPWLGEELSVNGLVATTLQSYHKVSTPTGTFQHKSTDAFVDLAAAMTFTTDWNISADLQGAHTRERPFNFSRATLLGRYLLLDDIAGDPISMTAGLSTSMPAHWTRTSLSMLYRAPVEWEGSLSFGKELNVRTLWNWRFWGLVALGQGTEGSPWLRTRLNIEKNFPTQPVSPYRSSQQIKLVAELLHGMGSGNLTSASAFNGYGGIAYHAVDLGLKYGYTFPTSWGNLSAEYKHRFHARNFPEQVNLLTLTYHFSLSF